VLHPHHRHLVAAWAQARTEEFAEVYRRWRPMVERSLAWLTRGASRRLPYRGVERKRVSHRCAAVNMQRLLNLGLVTRAPTADGSEGPPMASRATGKARSEAQQRHWCLLRRHLAIRPPAAPDPLQQAELSLGYWPCPAVS